jgi:hypothetical protein
MKLIIFPLILRQAVFFLVKPINGSLNNTIDYSNLGFLYGTAPTAPSVIFYVPESNLILQAISSTELVVSTLLAGPIILVSAKMINLCTLDTKITESYELLLTKTAFDVSIISLFCTIIVLVGFCVRHRWLKISFIHKYTFIFVGLQMIFSIWTIAIHYIKYPLSSTSSTILDIGKNMNDMSVNLSGVYFIRLYSFIVDQIKFFSFCHRVQYIYPSFPFRRGVFLLIPTLHNILADSDPPKSQLCPSLHRIIHTTLLSCRR